MTTGTKIFRIIVSVLLGLTILIGAFLATLLLVCFDRDLALDGELIYVAGERVTRTNADDVLGDGTVSYDATNHILTFDNATITYDYSVILSKIDLRIELIGENKFIMSGEFVPVIYAGDNVISKDIAFFGDGSLTVEFEGTSADSMGIFAEDIRIESDISISLPDSANIANGIYCEGNLTISQGATVTVNCHAANYSTVVKAVNNINVETGSTLNVSANPGTAEMCRGVNVGGSLVVWEDAELNVSVDDENVKTSECVNVYGALSLQDRATVTASAKKAYGIKGYGAVELNSGATLSASTEREGADILCYGAVANHGATVNGEVEALCGVHGK